MKNKMPEVEFQRGSKQAELWKLLRFGTDVAAARLAAAVNCESENYADQQPYLSAHFTHMNVRLEAYGLKIKPGNRRRSYRVVEL